MRQVSGAAETVPRDTKRNRPPHIYAIIPAIMPSALILVLKPFFDLERRGEISFDFAVGPHWQEEALLAASLVVVLRGNTLSDLRALRLAERHAIPIAYDIDDNFHEMPLASELGRSIRASRSIAVVDRFFRAASITRVYNPIMAELAAARGARVASEHVYFDPPDDLRPDVDAPTAHGCGEPLRLLYASARQASEAEEEPMMAALANVAGRRGSAVEIVLWKWSPTLHASGARVRFEAPVADYTAFLRRLIELRPAIGLAPLGSNRFFNSKTNNKYREYGGLGIPAIYSAGALYGACVRDGETGLLVANTPEAWEAAIERLLDDGGLRRRLADAALADVRRNYSYEAFLQSWLTIIGRLADRPRAQLERRRQRKMPSITLVGREWRRSPITPLLLELVIALGGIVHKKGTLAELNPGDVFIHVPGPDAPAAQLAEGAWGVVDLSLAGSSAQCWAGNDMARLIALRGTPGSTIGGALSVPNPTMPEGRYDAEGSEAMLLPLAETLLDRAPLATLRATARVRRGLRHIAAAARTSGHMAMRLRTHVAAQADVEGKPLDRLAAAARQAAALLRYRWNQERYERRLRRTRRV